MKIGINTNRLVKKGHGRYGDAIYEKVREAGFECTDFSMSDTNTILYTLPREEAHRYLLEEKKLAGRAGVTIFQVHGPWCWPPRDGTAEGREERLEKMKMSISMAAIMGAKYWVVHPIMPFGIHDKVTGEAEETRNMNLEFMRKLLAHAKENDVVICLENMPMPEFSIGTPEEILSFVREINDENFKICLDVGHVGVYDKLKAGDEVRRLGEELKVLHVHDSKLGADTHLMPRQGVTDWEDFALALTEIGYDGVFSLETNPPAGLSDSLYDRMSRLYFDVADEIANG